MMPPSRPPYASSLVSMETNTRNEHRKPLQNSATELSERGRPLGVYIHFPWCISKCPYCDFFSIEQRQRLPHQAYADAVLAELEHRASELEPAWLRSIYFGGGTPSLWDCAQLRRVLERVVDTFGATPQTVEITLECNPSSFDVTKCGEWRDAGVNRMSLGVQSLHDQSLEYLGRAHDSREALDALQTIIDSRFPSIGVDLIFGLPGRTVEDMLVELRQLPLSALSHVSAYALTIEPNTPFGALARKGRLQLAPEETVIESFLALHTELSAAGFEHYEISNYARPGERSKHNTGYWQGRDYLGLGVAAWGTITSCAPDRTHQTSRETLRYRNTTSIDRYLRMPTADASEWWATTPNGVLSEKEHIGRKVALSERLMLGLRTSDGVDLASLGSERDVTEWLADHRAVLEKLQSRGRVLLEGSRHSIPFPMWYLADGTISDLF